MCLRDTCFPPAPLGQWKTSAQRSCHLAGCARALSLLQPPVTPQPHGGWSPTFLLDKGGEISLPGASLPSQGNALGRFLHLYPVQPTGLMASCAPRAGWKRSHPLLGSAPSPSPAASQGTCCTCVEGMVLLVEAVCKILSPSFFHHFLAVFSRPLGRQREGGWYDWERRQGLLCSYRLSLLMGDAKLKDQDKGGKQGEREKQ